MEWIISVVVAVVEEEFGVVEESPAAQMFPVAAEAEAETVVVFPAKTETYIGAVVGEEPYQCCTEWWW